MTQLTKREQIAAMALQTLMEGLTDQGINPGLIMKALDLPESTYNFVEHYPAYLAKLAVAYTDSLLKHLAETEPVEKEIKGKIESSDSRPMNAEEIADWVYRSTNLSKFDQSLLSRYINDAIQYELNKAKR